MYVCIFGVSILEPWIHAGMSKSDTSEFIVAFFLFYNPISDTEKQAVIIHNVICSILEYI